MSKLQRVDAVGFAWYRRDTYADCLKIFDDAEVMPDTFDEWLAKANDTVRHLSLAGHRVYRVEIHPDTFPAWCRAHGFKQIDSKARSQFAGMKSKELFEAQSLGGEL